MKSQPEKRYTDDQLIQSEENKSTGGTYTEKMTIISHSMLIQNILHILISCFIFLKKSFLHFENFWFYRMLQILMSLCYKKVLVLKNVPLLKKYL